MQLRSWHRPMLVLTAAMLLLAAVATVGVAVDRRELLGAGVWVKPLKFGVSMAVFGATMAWLLSLPHRSRRLLWWLGTLTALILIVDVGIVAYYGAHGTLSHFNTSRDPVDARLTLVLGSSISLMFVANIAMAVLLVRQQVGGRALNAAVRGGFSVTVAGMGLAYLMVFANPKSQLVVDANGRIMKLPAGHSVGVPEGGPGLPILGWSTAGGDLRVPHFVGIHGLQVMLALALLLACLARHYPVLGDERVRARLVGVATAGYAGLLALVTWQALRGQPVLRPDLCTLCVLAALVAMTAAAATAALRVTPSVGRAARCSSGTTGPAG